MIKKAPLLSFQFFNAMQNIKYVVLENKKSLQCSGGIRQSSEAKWWRIVQLCILDNAVLKDYWCSRKQLALKKRPDTCPVASLSNKCCKCSAAKYLLMKAAAGPCWGTVPGTDLPQPSLLPPHHPAGALGDGITTLPHHSHRASHCWVQLPAAQHSQAKSSFLQLRNLELLMDRINYSDSSGLRDTSDPLH